MIGPSAFKYTHDQKKAHLKIKSLFKKSVYFNL